VVSKGGVAAPAGHVLKLAIQRHKARLSAEFTKERIRRGYATLEAFRQAVNEGELEEGQDKQKGSRHPRWVRVNTLASSLEKQLSTTFAGYEKTDDIGAVLSASGYAKLYFKDANIPNLLALPSRIDLSKSVAYTSGQIIFQDKASCFPAYLLGITSDDGDVIDGCAAPGNKTTHLAAIINEENESGKQQKVIAFERDKTRAGTLQKMVKLASADKIVKIKAGADFLAADPDSGEFAQVAAILLDPSCSGSGIVGRDDAIRMHLPETVPESAPSTNGNKSKKRKRDHPRNDSSDKDTTLSVALEESAPEETPTEDKTAERLTALSTFQLRILIHAMRFPKARKITYSTCSIHFEENEGVVARALASAVAKENGWRILERADQVEGLKKWSRRGVWEADKFENGVELSSEQEEQIQDSCIRCEKGTNEGTMGFFVAAFVRDDITRQVRATPSRVEAEDDGEWNGFSDNDAKVKNIAAQVGSPVASKRSKKKRKKIGST
jgi:putative methyltransferase